MRKNKFGLAGKPNIRISYVDKVKVRVVNEQMQNQQLNQKKILSMTMLGVFVFGSAFGAGAMINHQLLRADQFSNKLDNQIIGSDSEGIVAGAVTAEQWRKPLEFSLDDLEIVTDFLPTLIEENRHEPTLEEINNQDRRYKLREYFKNRKSPFADSNETIDAFLSSKNMRLMIAISFVESTMGKRCYYNNCSGIGGYPPNLRKYDSYADWIRDFDSLLERRYKGMKPEQMMGVYVQPGSPNWINGVRQILAELDKQGIE